MFLSDFNKLIFYFESYVSPFLLIFFESKLLVGCSPTWNLASQYFSSEQLNLQLHYLFISLLFFGFSTWLYISEFLSIHSYIKNWISCVTNLKKYNNDVFAETDVSLLPLKN